MREMLPRLRGQTNNDEHEQKEDTTSRVSHLAFANTIEKH